MKKLLPIIGFITAFSAGNAFANPNPVGILGLFQVENNEAYTLALNKLQKATSMAKCDLIRHGDILQENGDLGIKTPNKFVVFSCENSLLGTAEKRKYFDNFLSITNERYVIEGSLQNFQEGAAGSLVSERAYIVKVSHYNNEDPDKRDQELKNIREKSLSKDDRYKREVFIEGHRAVGMETPDEVAVLYYDTPAQGDRFRKNNADIMKMVGEFNDNHLNNYIYYFGQSIK